jgi:hypothetical protein
MPQFQGVVRQVIGPASLLVDSSSENLQYMGITENARSVNVEYYGSSWTKAITIRDHPGFIKDMPS